MCCKIVHPHHSQPPQNSVLQVVVSNLYPIATINNRASWLLCEDINKAKAYFPHNGCCCCFIFIPQQMVMFSTLSGAEWN